MFYSHFNGTCPLTRFLSLSLFFSVCVLLASQVRNSSTLLFSTLITRIFGVKKGKDEHSKKNRSAAFPSLTLLHQLKFTVMCISAHWNASTWMKENNQWLSVMFVQIRSSTYDYMLVEKSPLHQTCGPHLKLNLNTLKQRKFSVWVRTMNLFLCSYTCFKSLTGKNASCLVPYHDYNDCFFFHFLRAGLIWTQRLLSCTDCNKFAFFRPISVNISTI